MTHYLESFMVEPRSIPMLHIAPTPMRRAKPRIPKPEAPNELEG
jgi:hypothetical protein